MEKSSCWFKLNSPSLLPVPPPLRTMVHAGACLALLPCWAYIGASHLIWFELPVLALVLIPWNVPFDLVSWGASSRRYAPTPLLGLHGQRTAIVTWSGACSLPVARSAHVIARVQRAQVLWWPAPAAPCQVPRGLAQFTSVLPCPRSRRCWFVTTPPLGCWDGPLSPA